MSFAHKIRLGFVALALVSLSACATTTPGGGVNGSGDTDSERRLVIASWGGDFTKATREHLAEPFQEETGVAVEIVDVPGTQVTQLQSQQDAGKVQWDVLDSLGAADGYYMHQEGMLEPLSEDRKRRYEDTVGADKVTDFGFTFANLGYIIVCNNEKVPRCPDTLEELFNDETFPGRRSMPGEAYSQFATAAAEASGERPGTGDIDTLLEPIRGVRDSVTVWYTSGDQMDQALRQGEADMALHWSGRAYTLLDDGMDLTINWDGVYDPGFTAIAKGAPHRAEAEQFLDWVISNPQAQANWAEAMGYSVPSAEAVKLMPAAEAARLADAPENFEKLSLQDFDWYLENKRTIDDGIRGIVQGK